MLAVKLRGRVAQSGFHGRDITAVQEVFHIEARSGFLDVDDPAFDIQLTCVETAEIGKAIHRTLRKDLRILRVIHNGVARSGIAVDTGRRPNLGEVLLALRHADFTFEVEVVPVVFEARGDSRRGDIRIPGEGRKLCAGLFELANHEIIAIALA